VPGTYQPLPWSDQDEKRLTDEIRPMATRVRRDLTELRIGDMGDKYNEFFRQEGYTPEFTVQKLVSDLSLPCKDIMRIGLEDNFDGFGRLSTQAIPASPNGNGDFGGWYLILVVSHEPGEED
jgi:hypothetical protein